VIGQKPRLLRVFLIWSWKLMMRSARKLPRRKRPLLQRIVLKQVQVKNTLHDNLSVVISLSKTTVRWCYKAFSFLLGRGAIPLPGNLAISLYKTPLIGTDCDRLPSKITTWSYRPYRYCCGAERRGRKDRSRDRFGEGGCEACCCCFEKGGGKKTP